MPLLGKRKFLKSSNITQIIGCIIVKSEKVLLVWVCEIHYWVSCFLYSLEMYCLPFFTVYSYTATLPRGYVATTLKLRNRQFLFFKLGVQSIKDKNLFKFFNNQSLCLFTYILEVVAHSTPIKFCVYYNPNFCFTLNQDKSCN